jgi:hypothetical protein
MGQNDQNPVVSEEELEKSFTDALAELSKAIEDRPGLQKAGGDELSKGGKKKVAKADDEEYDDEDEGDEKDEEDEGEEDEPEDRQKSLEDLEDELRKSEDEDVAGALDVSPLLQQLVKSIGGRDEYFEERLDRLERIVKAQARVLEAQASLAKSTHEETRRIAQTPVGTNSVFSLQKSRFDERDLSNVDGNEVKLASTKWLSKGKIDINEAGRIEFRANKGTLFKSGDQLDQKVEKLLKSEKGDE